MSSAHPGDDDGGRNEDTPGTTPERTWALKKSITEEAIMHPKAIWERLSRHRRRMMKESPTAILAARKDQAMRQEAEVLPKEGFMTDLLEGCS